MPATDLSLLQDAAAEAGEIALSYFGRKPRIWDKDDNAGPVTEADLAVNEMLETALRKARPDYGWLSEESDDNEERLSTKRQFVIDPIDGTRAFIDGSHDWSHSLAVVEEGRVTAAVVHLPAKGRTYSAALGQGATRDGNPIQVAPSRPVVETEVLAARPNMKPAYWKAGVPPPFRRVFRSSLAYRLCLAAEGNVDAMMTLRRAWEWDIAAGALIVAEAGGRAADQRGASLIFNTPQALLDGVVAGGPLVDDLLAALA